MKRFLAVAVALVAAPAARAQSTLFTLEGKNWGDELGGGPGVAPIGDQNGDGRDDFLVAEPGYDGKAGADCGRVQLYGGTKGAPKHLATWEGLNAGDRLGEFMDDVLDLDGDGAHEFAIGSRAWPGGANRGRVDVYSGTSWKPYNGFKFTGENDGDEFGRIAGVGDVTGDKINDVLISAVGWNRQPNGHGSGRAYLYSGKDASIVRTWDGQPGEELGFRLAAVHADMNHDGLHDFAISSLEAGMSPPGGGIVFLYSALQSQWIGGWGSAISGGACAYVSDSFDFDGDGVREILIGAPGMNGGFGQVTLRPCTHVFDSYRYYWAGSAEAPLDGETAMAGDVDGDGYGDFLFSSSGFDFEGGADVGMVQLMSGRHGRQLTRYVGRQPGAPIGGEAMAGGCDLDGDGRSDLLVGAPGWDTPSQSDVGQVSAFAGDDLYLTLSHRTAYANDFVTVSTAGGAPNKAMICACTEIDGIPVFLPMLASMAFDANGEFFVVPLVDAAWTGHDLVFQSFGLPATGRKLEISAAVPIALR